MAMDKTKKLDKIEEDEEVVDPEQLKKIKEELDQMGDEFDDFTKKEARD
jgi:hypothetical protein